MPPNTTTKRPGVVAWVVFGLLVVIAIVVVKAMFFAAIPRSNVTQTASGLIAPSYYGGTGVAMDSIKEYAAAPPTTMSNEMRDAAGSAAGSPAQAQGQAQDMQRIIKTGALTLRVQDTPKAVTDAQTIVSGRHGYVESSSMTDPGAGPRTAYLTLRVPADAFDATVQDLKAMAVVVLSESVHGQDVTSEFVDLEADLRNAQAEEASYLQIMQRAGKIDEVLQVARALADVRGRIERLEGRKRYLENQTDLATVSLTLTEETRVEVPGRTWKPLEVLRDAVRQLVESLQNLVDFLIRAIIGIVGLLLPILLIVAFVLWIGWKIVKAIMRRMKL